MWLPSMQLNEIVLAGNLERRLLSPAVGKSLREVSKLLPSVLDGCSPLLLYTRVIWEVSKPRCPGHFPDQSNQKLGVTQLSIFFKPLGDASTWQSLRPLQTSEQWFYNFGDLKK